MAVQSGGTGFWVFKKLEQIKDKKEYNIAPCPGCGLRPARDCGYGVRDPWTNEFDCEAPENDPDSDEELWCEDCHHLYCEQCQEWEDLFKIE